MKLVATGSLNKWSGEVYDNERAIGWFNIPPEWRGHPPPPNAEGDKTSKNFLCNIRKKRTDRPKVGGVSGRSRNSAPSRKGCVVNGQKTKASNK